MADKKFDENYFKNRKISGYEDYWKLETKIRRVIFPKILEDVTIKPNMKKVLDVGCAFGFLLKCFEQKGCDVYGIDISEYAINQAKKITKAKLYVHDVDNGLTMFPDNFFDLITMINVIEHLKSPYNVLCECYRVLKPKGKIVLTTPNLNCLDRYILKVRGKENNWHGFYDKTHLYLFTTRSLKFLLERVGFKVMKVETPFHFFLMRQNNNKTMKLIGSILAKTDLGGEMWIVGEK